MPRLCQNDLTKTLKQVHVDTGERVIGSGAEPSHRKSGLVGINWKSTLFRVHSLPVSERYGHFVSLPN